VLRDVWSTLVEFTSENLSTKHISGQYKKWFWYISRTSFVKSMYHYDYSYVYSSSVMGITGRYSRSRCTDSVKSNRLSLSYIANEQFSHSASLLFYHI
jgi:hypothetical protein